MEHPWLPSRYQGDPVSATLARHWPLPRRTDLRDELLTAWGEPSRGHHGLRHLAEVVQALRLIATASPQMEAQAWESLVLAAWFHDAVYDAAPAAEERSAAWARQALNSPGISGAERPIDVDEVVRLVLLTTTHTPAPHDLPGQLLCDADLAVLGSPDDRYQAYAAGVRREYIAVPAPAYARARISILEQFLARERIFTSAPAHERWESAARANLRAEIAVLATW